MVLFTFVKGTLVFLKKNRLRRKLWEMPTKLQNEFGGDRFDEIVYRIVVKQL